MTRASILVPTHDHASTLGYAVRSALGQTETDLEVLIIGDGVDAAVRAVASGLAAADSRVRFLDLPKGPHHGEIHRDTAIRASVGRAILYLCDDDLLLPEHVADLCALLEDSDIVQSRNGYLDPDGRIHLYAGDLSDPRHRALMLDESLEYNFVSLTGTGHTRAFYDEVGRPWTTTPPGVPPDLHQWRRMMSGRNVRGATSRRMTALQFPTHLDGRGEWTAEERTAELAGWSDALSSPEIRRRVDALLGEATWRALIDAGPREMELVREMNDLRRTFSWRITSPLRAVRRRLGD